MGASDDSPPIDPRAFQNVLFALLDETFKTHHGIYLDKDTSLAAQVTHVIFYLEVLERYILNQDAGKVDWGEIWCTVEKVTPTEWDALRVQLESTYRRIDQLFRGVPAWDEHTLGSALAIVVHSAYHLGEIRQALCTLK